MDNATLNQINVSIGTAGVLGLIDVVMDVAPTTAYLMLGGRCSMACGFCAQARTSQASALNLSRVTWPEFPLAEMIDRLAVAVGQGRLRRCCLQVTVGQGYFKLALAVVQAIRSAVDVPLDAAILPPTMRHVDDLMAAGVDHIGFGLDAACERVFGQVKGGSWASSLRLVEETAGRYPGRAAAHLIVGLGETEREMVDTMQMLHDWGVTVGLFAFTPVRGTEMAHLLPPPLAVYRRMQAARYLIDCDLARASDFTFSPDGRLVDFGLNDLPGLLADGIAFETCGCPDCNRPYYNERPGQTMYNYPRPLGAQEIGSALAALQEEW